MTPRVVWALAGLTLRQSLRRKVLLVLVLFVATVLVGSRVMPSHNPVKRLEMLIVLCLYSISFFGIIVAIFLSATGLPDDRTEGTITTVLTKPVGRLNYLLGRIAGFAMTLGIILLVMAVVSWAFIRWEGHRAASATGRKDLLVAKRGIDPTEVLLREGEQELRLAGDAEAAVLRGSEDRVLVFRFRSHLHRLPDGNQTFEMTPTIWTAEKLPNTPAEVVVENPATHERRPFEVTLDSDRPIVIRFPAALVHPVDGVDVSVRRLLSGAYVHIARGSFRLMTPPGPFEYAYLKSLVMIFLSFLLVVVVSITASTFLSAWVAVLVAFVAYFFAELQEVLLEFMVGLKGKAVGLLGTEAFRHAHHHGPAAAPAADPWYVVAVNNVYWASLWVLTRIFPNFDRFDASPFLTQARDVPANAVAAAALVVLSYGICYLVVGHVIFWRRELVP